MKDFDDSGYDGWMSDEDRPRPPGEGVSPEAGGKPEEESLPPGDYDVSIQAPAGGDRQRVLFIDSKGELRDTDHGNLISRKARESMVKRFQVSFVLADEQAARLLERLTRRWLQFFKLQQEQQKAGPSRKSAAELLEEMPDEVRQAAEEALHQPGLLRAILDDIRALDVAGEKALVTVLYLVGVSRLLPRPLSARVHGPSASGKSYLIESVAGLFPPETVLLANQMTPQALYHLEPGSLKNRWVVGGERPRRENDDSADATKALREMQASGRLSKLMPVKVGGEITSVLIEQEGPIAFSESTTRSTIFDEDANRCVALHTDETREQTQAIIRAVAASYSGNGNGCHPRRKIVEKHWAMQRLLCPCDVVIPYAEALGDLLRCEQVEMRRGVSQIFSTVRALALLHQFQRDRDGGGRLVADLQDYDIACRLLDAPMARLLGIGVSRPAAHYLHRLHKQFGKGKPFSTLEAKQASTEGSRSAIYGWLHELRDAGLLEEVFAGRGRTPSIWKLPRGTPGPTDESSPWPIA
jgi:hypothetical protein